MKRRPTLFQRMAQFFVSVIFLLTASVGVYECVSRPPQLPDNDAVVPQPDDPATEQQNTAPPERKEDFYTILVGGMDNDNGGSDTNLLVAVDAKNCAINILSLPRDTLLNVSWSVKKLNNACHHGGFERTMQEVSNLLGVPVDFYVTVDMSAFVKLVDEIGGVTFNIPVDMDYDDPYQDLSIHFPAGERLLSGEDAIKVIRWRQNNDGTGYPNADIGRIATQQAFLRAAVKQTLQLSNLDKIDDFARIIHESVSTNLKLSNLVWFGEQVFACGTDAITFHTLPGDGAGWYSGGSYYILDDEATLELINAHFNPYPYELTLDDMDILVP